MSQVKRVKLSFVPVVALAVLVAVIYFTVDPALFFEPAWLLPITNAIFVTLVSLVVSWIAAHNYQATGRIQILLLGSGVLAFGIGGLLGGMLRSTPGVGANLNVTIYNCGALVAAALHFIAAIILLAGISVEVGPRRKLFWLILSYGGLAGLMVLLTAACLAGRFPIFFVQGLGPTPLRQGVLGSAAVLFAFSFVIFMGTYWRNREVFLYWYSCALALTAISLTAFLIQSAIGSPLGWVGRGAQYLGGIYFLIAILTAMRSAQARHTSLDRVLTTSLSAAEEQFRALAENSPDAIRRFDSETRHVYVNPAGLRLYGKPAEAVAGKTMEEIGLPLSYCAAWRGRIGEVFATGQRIEVEEYFRGASGSRFYQSQCAAEYGADGSVANVLVVSRDLTELKQAEAGAERRNVVLQGINRIFKEALTCQTEEELGETCLAVAEEITASKFGFVAEIRADGLLHAIAISDPGWEACRMTGQDGQRRLPANFAIRGIYGRVLTDGRAILTNEPKMHPDRIGLPDGHPPLTAFLGVPLVRGNRTAGVIAVGNREGGYGDDEVQALEALAPAVVEAFDRKRAEAKVRQSQETLSELMERAPFGVYIVDSQFRIAQVNSVSQNGAFRNVRPVIGRDFAEAMRVLWPEPVAAEIIAAFRHTLETGESYYSPRFVNPREDIATVESYEWELHRMTLPDGQHGVICYYFDSTKLREAERALRESGERFRVALQNSRIAVYTNDLELRYTWIHNPMPGFTAEQMVGKTDEELLPRESVAELVAMKRRVVAGGQGERRQIGTFIAGRACTFDVTAEPLWGSTGTVQGVIVAAADISDIVAAKAAAEAASAAKSQFLANMSHELRTPMNAILGMIDVALPKAIDPTVQDCLETAKGSADLLLTLLDDLLDSAKIESGKLELEVAPFSLRRMLDQITRVLAVRASEKGLTFYCRVPQETPDGVVGDRMRLQQILLNLAGNAIKFTERGEVEIGVRTRSKDGDVSLEFAVRDTGIGIPPSGQERLFQPFGQTDASMSRRFGGTGLGLSISKSLVELMGGRIWVESELGKGSTFSFSVRLPLAKELPADLESPVALAESPCAPLRVLLVEDNPANQKLAMYLLQDRGHAVEVAGDGLEALRLTEQNAYDVILMDVQMPGMNGLEATAAIRNRETRSRRVPIIAMTAHAMKGDRDRCLAAGMDGYLSKPVNAQEMIGLVESLGCGAQAAGPPMPTGVGRDGTSPPTTSRVFDAGEALARCFNSPAMVREMVQCFYDEVEHLFPQMREALEKGNLTELGRLGHRMKGTVVYLGAAPAKEAALRVERFCKCGGGTAAEAEEAVNVLENECRALKAALAEHPFAAEAGQDDAPKNE